MNWFAKKIFDGEGEGKDLKNRVKSICCLSSVFKNLKYFSEKSKSLYKKLTFEAYAQIRRGSFANRFIYRLPFLIPKLRLRSANYGAILVEFAVCMPVLIILLFYIHDLVKIKRYYSQAEFVGQQMVNMIQNIARKRVAAGQAVTIKDVGYAAKLAYLSIYPGTTIYRNNPERKCFHIPRIFVYYVEGDGNGKASCKWGLWMHTRRSSVGAWNYGTFTSSDTNSIVTMGKNVDPSSIYPTLKINEKSKVIIEIQLSWSSNNSEYTDVNGKQANSAREVFGCFIVTPKPYKGSEYFTSVVIFTPYGGFSETKITGA